MKGEGNEREVKEGGEKNKWIWRRNVTKRKLGREG